MAYFYKGQRPEYIVPHGRVGSNGEVELKRGGANIPVTEENVGEYIHLAAKYWVMQLRDRSQLQIVAANLVFSVNKPDTEGSCLGQRQRWHTSVKDSDGIPL